MKYLTFVFLILSNLSVAQDSGRTPEQIETNKRFETAKEYFLNNQFNRVLDYYDSILSQRKYTRFETYKMAYESCSKLTLLSPVDSAVYSKLADEVYNEAIKWHGKMQVEDRWDSLKIKPNKQPDSSKVLYQKPSFPGGIAAFNRYISQELSYPEEAIKMGIEGKVYVHFVINKDGSVDAVNVVRGIGGGCEEEAVRVIANAPNFIPGKRGGKPVYVRMSLPINFNLTAIPPKNKRKKEPKETSKHYYP